MRLQRTPEISENFIRLQKASRDFKGVHETS
jgi:hypothetical protein